MAAKLLRAEIDIEAPVTKVWSLVSDLGRMPQWSPELVKMVALKRGGLRLGQWYLGINRRGAVVWPTRNVVTLLEPGRRVALDTRSSGALWIYEVAEDGDGTRVSLVRPVPRGLTVLAKVFAGALRIATDGRVGCVCELWTRYVATRE